MHAIHKFDNIICQIAVHLYVDNFLDYVMVSYVNCVVDDKKHLTRGEEETIILSGMLVKIIEESMHIFWNFVRTDERNANLKGLQETQVDHKDLELLLDIRKDLQKVLHTFLQINFD